MFISIILCNDYKICLRRSQSEKLTSIRNSCRAFFMELVSTLCFGTHSAPEPSLIEMLINTVFTERQETEVGTREFSPYHEAKSDKVPVIRSFLLQLLLEHKWVANYLATTTWWFQGQKLDYMPWCPYEPSPLLFCSTEKVKEYLEYYFYKSQQAFTDKEVDQNLCLLCIQCFEVSNSMCRVHTYKHAEFLRMLVYSW